MFWLRSSEDVESSPRVIVKGWTTPETTAGGALMDGLAFCGVDLRQDCPQVSGASSAFWTSAYAKYAADLQGDIHVVLGEVSSNNLTPLLEGAIPNLDPLAVTSVTIYSEDCDSEDFQRVVSSTVNERGMDMEIVSCAKDLMILMVCQNVESEACMCLTREDKPPTKGKGEEMARKSDDGGLYEFLFCLPLLVLFLAGVYFTTREVFRDYATVPDERSPLQPKQ
jgi:hypothetical protein